MGQLIQDQMQFGYGTGLNWDDDVSLMPKGDSKYRLNVTITDPEHGGAAIATLGFLKLKNFILPGANAIWTAIDYPYAVPKPITQYDMIISSTYLHSIADRILVISIKTDAGNYKIYHKSAEFSSEAEAAASIISKIFGLGDPNIIDVSNIANHFYINILINNETQDVISVATTLNYIGDYVSGDRDIVGVKYHEKDNEVYLFYSYDKNNTATLGNLIVRYDYNYDVSELITTSGSISGSCIPYDIARWSKYNMIKAALIGDNKKKYLIWTDGINPQMIINVDKAVNSVYGYTGDAYMFNSLEECRIGLNLIKAQPSYPPTVTYDLGVSYAGGDFNILKSPPQFMMRYVYEDDQRSKWSMVSQVAPHPYEQADGSFAKNSENLVYVIDATTPAVKTLARVQFAYRLHVLDHWKLFATKDYETPNIEFTFTATELAEVIDDDEAIVLFDNIPLTSGTLTSLNDNRILLGDNVLNYPNTELDVTVTPMTETLTSGQDSGAIWVDASVVNSTTKDILVTYADIGHYGSIYVVFSTPTKTHIVQGNSTSSAVAGDVTALVNSFVSYISTNIVGKDPFITGVSNSANRVRIVHTSGKWNFGTTTVYGQYEKRQKIKNGIKHYLGIVYYDEFGRRGYINQADEDGTYVPFYTQQTTYSNNEYFDYLSLAVNHFPPSWAYYWGVYYGDASPVYRQVAIKVSDFQRVDGNLRIKVDQILNNISVLNPAFNGSYEFTKGDRIRWIGVIGSYTSGSGNKKRVALLTEYIDTEIFGKGGDFNEYLIIPDYVGFIASKSAIDNASYVLVEIYTPNKLTQPTFYYETPYIFPVINPGSEASLHGGSPTDQTLSNAAVVDIKKMDFRLMQHFEFNETTGRPVACYVDSQSFSNYFNSRVRNYGKPHITNPDIKQIRLNNLMWGGVFIPYTRVNALNEFKFGDEKSMDDKFGRIVGLDVTGDILNVTQQSKMSTVYLQAEVSIGADGSQILSFSPNVIGSIRPLVDPYGSGDKYSIVPVGNYIYGFDLQSGVPWRKSHNGIEDLSKYKMKAYFKAKAKALLLSGRSNVHVHCGYDANSQILFVTFVDYILPANNETVAFHEPTNRWISFYSFIPDLYASIRDVQMMSVKDINIYKHGDTGTAKRNFYGTAYSSVIWAVGNIYPSNIKTFNTIVEDANSIWNMSADNSIIVDEDAITYTDPRDNTVHNGSMYSRLMPNALRYRMGKFFANFRRDTSDGTLGSRYNLYNGRKLRGRTITLKLVNSDNADVYLKSITIGSSI